VVEVYEKGEKRGRKRRIAATGDRRYGRKNPAFVGRG
jgi:hypothetical protein